MLFNSYLFIFIFLPMVLIGWFGLNKINFKKTAEIFLIGMSLWFYAYFNYSYLFIIVGSCLFNYICSLLMDKLSGSAARKIIGIIGITANLGILFYYKYYDFFIENINVIFKQDYNLKHILLPLGISFFTFQQISYIIDRMKGEAPHYEMTDYLSFVTFFPQLIAGPIVLHSEFIPQFHMQEKRKFNTDNFTEGCVMSILGLAKKVLIADTLALVVNNAYEGRYYFTTWSVLVFLTAYAFELYFDFSGYCDIAVGLGKMFNIELPRNFNQPYKSCSMKEFWKRWHMTLSRFFTTYIYLPLGGGKRGTIRKQINTMTVFLLSGLWHGSSWNYVIWGFLSGIAVVFNNINPRPMKKEILTNLGTFFYFSISLIFFRSETFADAIFIFKKLFQPVGIKYVYDMSQYLDIPELYIFKEAFDIFAPQYTGLVPLAAFLLLMLICLYLLRGKNSDMLVKEGNYTLGFTIKLAVLFVWSVISLSGVSTFLYFNF